MLNTLQNCIVQRKMKGKNQKKIKKQIKFQSQINLDAAATLQICGENEIRE